MTQPAEELSGNRQGQEKEKSQSKKRKEKRKEKQKANKNKGTYGLTKAEDKEPHRSVAQPRVPLGPAGKQHVSQADPSQQPSTTMFRAEAKSPAPRKAPPTTRPPAASLQGDSPIAVPPNATWEEVCQFALNSSILSGMFEDVRFLACSRRSQALGRAGNVRALHGNSALVRKALTSGHLLLDTNVLPDVLEDADIRDIDASFQAGHHDYLEDSDLEDGDISIESGLEPEPEREEQSDRENDDDDDDEESASDTGAEAPGTEGITNPAKAPALNASTEDGPKDVDGDADAAAQEDGNETSSQKDLGNGACPQAGPGQGEEKDIGPTPKDVPTSKATGLAQVDGPEGSAMQPSNAHANDSEAASRNVGMRPGTRTVLVTDTAFQTLRTFIFFAYTGRVAFAPLRSQGMIYRDSGRDASQLPVCSSKSMYRLAVKYGNEMLRIQAGSDILSKLSTHNILDELSSQFTCRYPDIQDMELNFLLAHIKHPEVTTRLPWWINRFALGELAACADTFGMLIHKLSCIAPPPDQFGEWKPPSFCPRGCPPPTIRAQFRCTTCGYIMA